MYNSVFEHRRTYITKDLVNPFSEGKMTTLSQNYANPRVCSSIKD